jgi:hypothetical protein
MTYEQSTFWLQKMIQKFASHVAPEPVGEHWVPRFLHRNREHLLSKWTASMDRNRHQADSKHSYNLYFDLLQHKIEKYDVEPRHTYNMDEKGFMIGVTGRSKRVFSRRLWERKNVREALQDGSREWITILAAICADGEKLLPGLIYAAGSGALQSTWVADVKAEEHDVFIISNPSGWSNNDVRLESLDQVFYRCTKQKARRDYRLLTIDDCGSHIIQDFIDYCFANRILWLYFHPIEPAHSRVATPMSSLLPSSAPKG